MSQNFASAEKPNGPESSDDASVETIKGGAAQALPGGANPRFVFFGVVTGIALILDALTKAWAEITLSQLPARASSIVLIEERLTFSLAYNKGGAFGMLSHENDAWRTPFFLFVSIAASVFIISLYRKVRPDQTALKWGLPLVLGGALGNLADRMAKGKVVDFIDYRADWVELMNRGIRALNDNWHVSRHWPTFNVADICICIGVGLMAVDMFTSSRGEEPERVATRR